MKPHALSIILYFRNQRELAEQTLTSIYEQIPFAFDLYIIDDASDDDTANTIRSVVEHFNHDDTFFFEYPKRRGRALSIQETLPQCTAPIIWLPTGFELLDGGVLETALSELRTSSALFGVSGEYSWPRNWSDFLEKSQLEVDLPSDNQIFIHRSRIEARQQFVNPFLEENLSLEWMFRLTLYQSDDAIIADLPEFVIADASGIPAETVTEMRAGLLRNKPEFYPQPDSFDSSNFFEKYTSAFKEMEQVGTFSDVNADSDSGSATLKPNETQVPEDDSSDENVDLTPDCETHKTEVFSKENVELDSEALTQKIGVSSDVIVDSGAGHETHEPEESDVSKDEPFDISAKASASQPPEIQENPTPVKSKTIPFVSSRHKIIDFVVAGKSLVAADLKPKIDALVTEGEYLEALKVIASAVENHPKDVDLIWVKIKILERMRRYVEAAELKHKIKTGNLSGEPVKMRREKMLVVDPTEDDGVGALIDKQDEPFPSRPATARVNPDTLKSSEEAEVVNSSTQEKTVTKDSVSNSNRDVEESEHIGEATPSEARDVSLKDRAKSKSEDVYDTSLDETDKSDGDSDETIKTEVAGDSTYSPSDENSASEISDEIESATNTDENVRTRFTAKPIPAEPGKPRISIVIPTAADGKKLLENTLISLSRVAMMPDRELIIIDNASLDETYLYLKQLQKDSFMGIRVITNTENKGFAAAVNQGINLSRGRYVLVMHNDVTFNQDIPGKMADLMDVHQEVACMGPVTGVTLNTEQRMHQPEEDAGSLRMVDYIDSFCMMLRRNDGFRFDERFELAYFEDVDLCQVARNAGRSVAVARGLHADHIGGATTAVLGTEPHGKQYWKNVHQFNGKWDSHPQLPSFGEDTSPIFQLITISECINPYYPEPDLLSRAKELFTSEVRHEMVQSRHARNDLFALIRLMMVLDVRDALRLLEAQLADHPTEDALIYELIEFYYRKHIYSRGEKYLNQLDPHKRTFAFNLLHLRILMGDKKLEEATDVLNMLIEERPSHPELAKITADIHNLYGNKKEASQFYTLAHQANPFDYNKRRDLLF